MYAFTSPFISRKYYQKLANLAAAQAFIVTVNIVFACIAKNPKKRDESHATKLLQIFFEIVKPLFIGLCFS